MTNDADDADAYRLTQAQRLLQSIMPIVQKEDQISPHEIRVYESVREHGGWLTAKDIAAKADVADRTARAHASAMAEVGVFDLAKAFGGYRYRIKTAMGSPGDEYVSRLEAAKRIYGRDSRV